MTNTNINLGIDLGGTKIEIAALDFSTNNIIYRKRIPAPQNVYKETLQAISCLLYTSPSPRDDELSRMPSSA